MYPDSYLFYIINYKHIKLQSGMVIFLLFWIMTTNMGKDYLNTDLCMN